MGNRLPSTPTPVTNSQMKAALSQSWQRLWSETPSEKSLYILLAHWSLETGGGSKMIQYNVGNKKAKLNGSWGDFTVFQTYEIINGVRVDMQDAFRAYPSLDAGCDDYLKGLRGNGNFARAFPAIIAGDPVDFAHQLKLARYYTADEKLYKSAMLSRYYAFAADGKYLDKESLGDALTSLGFADVKSYQLARGLTADGIAGTITRGTLALEVGA